MSLDQLIYPKGMVHRLPALTYIHVLDTNTQAIRLETGPKTFVCLSGQKVVFGPEQFVTVPPQQYVTVSNPCMVDQTGAVVLDKNGQALLRHGDVEVRTERSPFALFPGEKLDHAVKALPTVAMNAALRMEATRDIVAPDGKIIHKVGEEWLELGPKVLIPHPGARIVSTVTNHLIAADEALHIRASRDLIDFEGKKRLAGEEYLVKFVGSYLPILDEVVLAKLTATILTPKVALLLQAKLTFTDQFGKRRKVGERWLVTQQDTDSYIPGVEETIVHTQTITTLTARQYCVVENPLDENGRNRYGVQEIRRGPQTFFLQPDEFLAQPITDVLVLQEDDAYELMAREKFEDEVAPGKTVTRMPGQIWRIVGPKEYWKPLQVDIRNTFKPVLKLPSFGIILFDFGQLIGLALGFLAVMIFLLTRLF